jgi:glutamate-1-semialdehyde 2,1-aminomutase
MTAFGDLDGLSSEALYERARAVLAGGVSHEARYQEPHPKYIARAKGARKWEVDGTEYIDYAMGSASLLLGHAHPDVINAMTEQLQSGSFYSDCHPLEVLWGEQIQALIPCAERVRFVGSGTEATMLAIRIGRAFSGRSKVLRFEGHYHGWHDFAMLGMKAPYDEMPTLGMLPEAADATVVVAPDAARVETALKADNAIGTIICEVSGANYGSVPLPDGFLKELRALADRYGVVLIFDEVITGFRWSPGGRQARDGIVPDVTTLAKVLTGGMPGGAVVGKAEIMALLDPRGKGGVGGGAGVVHKGTFNGNPVVAAAGIAALNLIAIGDVQSHADKMAAKIRAGIAQIFTEHQVDATVYGDSSTFHMFFGNGARNGIETRSAQEIRGVDTNVVKALRSGLRARNVDLMSHTSGVTSLAHTDADIDKTLSAFNDTIEEMIQAGLLGRV